MATPAPPHEKPKNTHPRVPPTPVKKDESTNGMAVATNGMAAATLVPESPHFHDTAPDRDSVNIENRICSLAKHMPPTPVKKDKSTNGMAAATLVTPRRSFAQSSIGSGTCDQRKASFTGSTNGVCFHTRSQTSVFIKNSKNIGTQEKLCILRGDDGPSSGAVMEMASASSSSTGDAKESASEHKELEIKIPRDKMINTTIVIQKHDHEQIADCHEKYSDWVSKWVPVEDSVMETDRPSPKRKLTSVLSPTKRICASVPDISIASVGNEEMTEFVGSHFMNELSNKAVDTSAFVPIETTLSTTPIQVDDTDVKEQVGMVDGKSLSVDNAVDEEEEDENEELYEIIDRKDVKHGNDHHDVIQDPRQNNLDVVKREKDVAPMTTFMEQMNKFCMSECFRYLAIGDSCVLLQCFIKAWKTRRCFITKQKNRRQKRLVPCDNDCYRFTCSLIHYLVCRIILGPKPLQTKILEWFKKLDEIISAIDTGTEQRKQYKNIIVEVYNTTFVNNETDGQIVEEMMAEKRQFSNCCNFVNRRVILMKKGNWSDPNRRDKKCKAEWTVYRQFLEYLGIFPAPATSSARSQALSSFIPDKFVCGSRDEEDECSTGTVDDLNQLHSTLKIRIAATEVSVVFLQEFPQIGRTRITASRSMANRIAGDENNATVLRSLSPEENSLVQTVLYGRPLGIKRLKSGDSVWTKTMRTLCPGKWLSDEVIHYYFKLLAMRDEQLSANDPAWKRSHFFKSFFLTQLFDEGRTGKYTFANVKR